MNYIEKAVEYVKENGKITNKEYQEINLVAKPTATRDLSELVEYGIFKNTGKGTGSYYEIIGSFELITITPPTRFGG